VSERHHSSHIYKLVNWAVWLPPRDVYPSTFYEFQGAAALRGRAVVDKGTFGLDLQPDCERPTLMVEVSDRPAH
jgi:hypothetical protein